MIASDLKLALRNAGIICARLGFLEEDVRDLQWPSLSMIWADLNATRSLFHEADEWTSETRFLGCNNGSKVARRQLLSATKKTGGLRPLLAQSLCPGYAI